MYTFDMTTTSFVLNEETPSNLSRARCTIKVCAAHISDGRILLVNNRRVNSLVNTAEVMNRVRKIFL